jgi:hypothetical protein
VPKTIDAADRADSQLYRRGVVQSPLIRLGELPALVEKKRREAAVTTADPVVCRHPQFLQGRAVDARRPYRTDASLDQARGVC